jgi:nitronate monooxygenase
MAVTTAWAQGMGMTAPVLNAPMGGVAGGHLAAAVSGAGGLGMIGVGSAGSIARLEEEAGYPRHAGVAFGIGLLDWAVADRPDLLTAAISLSPALIAVSFCDDWSWAAAVRAAGIVTASQVCAVDEAQRASGSGVDVLVARGAEGGGHGDPRVGTLPLLAAILDAVDVPVLAAGGIASARGLAAVLAAGAAGAWIGTAFAACRESLHTDAARSVLLQAGETDTMVTDVFDVALGYPWPVRFPERVIRNGFADRWTGRSAELANDRGAREQVVAATAASDHRAAAVDAGQGVGQVRASLAAGDVVRSFCDGAAALLGRWPPSA